MSLLAIAMTPKIANAIRTYRLRHAPPLTQRELADMLGMSQTRISKYELGSILPTLEVAFAIAIALRTPVERVFYGLEELAGDRVRAVARVPGDPVTPLPE